MVTQIAKAYKQSISAQFGARRTIFMHLLQIKHFRPLFKKTKTSGLIWKWLQRKLIINGKS